MILFKPFLLAEIKRGRKTETRRLWKKLRVKPGSIHWACHKLFQNEPDCIVKVLSVHREHLLDITPEGVIHEGFADGNVQGFIDGFKQINAKKAAVIGTNYTAWNPEVWVVRFKLVTPPRQTKLMDNDWAISTYARHHEVKPTGPNVLDLVDSELKSKSPIVEPAVMTRRKSQVND